MTLSVVGLDKAFGRVRALDDVTLAFTPGSVTALLGPNSAGKTTLLKAVLGLVRPDGGEVRMNGAPADEDGSYRSEIGFMPQLPNFPEHMTGAELAEMLDDLRDFDGTPDESLIDDFEIADDMSRPFGHLSGGTRQKVNAALAFRYAAPVLILDEPTAGLDPVASLVLKQKVEERRAAGCTIVVTSHDLGSLDSLAEHVVFLLEGRLCFDGALDALLEQTGRRTLEAAIAELMLRTVGESRGAGEAANSSRAKGVA